MTKEEIVAAVKPHVIAWDEAEEVRLKDAWSGEDRQKRLVDQAAALGKILKNLDVWANVLANGHAVAKGHRVLRARSTYTNDLLVSLNNVHVVAEVFLHAGRWRHRITDLSVFDSLSYRSCPTLGTDLLLENSVYRPALAASPWIAERAERLRYSVRAVVLSAVDEARKDAPGLVAAHRAANSSTDRAKLIEKLSEPLIGNSLAKMDPESLAMLLRAPSKDVDRILRFMTANRVIAGGATAETVSDAVNVSIVKEVMKS